MSFATLGGSDHSPRHMLSVVMPSLNQMEFIEQAVWSVLRQGLVLELIVVDGGSTDGTVEFLHRVAADGDKRLKFVSEPDLGPADAVNKAVAMAGGVLIGWLNSDDIYEKDSVSRAISHFINNPSHIMAYGHGVHVDAFGSNIGRYPTLPPSTPWSTFSEGCFICQPTAFFYRDAFLKLGGLDTRLRAAFDFDLWLRMFKAYPGRIGFIDTELAQSRLHAGGITARFRERVALEGMEVVRRHVGPPPAHWLLTHLEELCALQPFQPESLTLHARFSRVLDKAAHMLSPQTESDLLGKLDGDWRVRLSGAEVYVGVHADGWASDTLAVRLLQCDPPVRSIRLYCRQHAPGGGGVLSIAISGSHGEATPPLRVDGNGEFDFTLEVGPVAAGEQAFYQVRTEGGFVPAEWEPGSTDRRCLAFRVEACELLR